MPEHPDRHAISRTDVAVIPRLDLATSVCMAFLAMKRLVDPVYCPVTSQ